MSRAVTPVPGGVDGRFAQTVVETSASSWAETNIAQLLETGEVAPEPDQGDVPGPVSLAAAVSAPVEIDATDAAAEADAPDAPAPQSRLLVVGDSDFAANYALGIQGNQDLFVNAVSWLAQQEDLIAIRPREAADTRLTLTAGQLRGLFWLSLLVVPGVVLGAGLYTWSRRRQ
jgi:hypothetical protein